ncbi:O-antigen ligase family protein [Rubellimicrobium roseum]|uniref:O-antigen ligase family protein n=1 Tax=Rubellimicrobium roseum TaxID=687525 RepID=A0A5C4NNZ2_9RHOB|nr:O-antigen ligase family protein [Rubellimicrobium roseum]TNC74786.1 O-antigen ligase family protein [Rubellimicrobium roseum]
MSAYLLCVAVPVAFDLGPLTMTGLRVLLLALTVPLAIRLFMGHFGRVFLTDILFTLHILWAGAALWVNNPDRAVEQMGSVGVEFLGGYMIARAYVRSPEVFLALCRRLVLIVLCILPFSLYELMTGRPIVVEMIYRIPGLSSVEIVTIPGRMELERVQATFAHPIHYGLFCSVAFSLAFVALKGVSSTPWRYLSSGLVAFSGFMALSSGALLAVVLQVALIVWASIFVGLKSRWWLLVGLFALGYVAIDLLSTRSPIRVFMSYATFSAHNAYWRGIIFEWGMKNVWGSPLFGIGLNDWVRPWYMHSGSMDNFWLVMAVRYGLPGLILLAVGYMLGLMHIMRRNFEGDERLTLIRRAWVFTFLGLSFTLCTVHVWTSVYSFVFFMFGAGMWLILVEPEKTQPAAAEGRRPPSRPSAAVPSQPPSAVAHRPSQPSYTRFPASPQPARKRD